MEVTDEFYYFEPAVSFLYYRREMEVQSEKNYIITVKKADWKWCKLHDPEEWKRGLQGMASTANILVGRDAAILRPRYMHPTLGSAGA